MLRHLLSPSLRTSPRIVSRRNLAAAGGGHVPVPQSMQAKLWEGHPRKEGWESTMLWWYTASFALLVGVLGFAPNTEIESWAKQEARARLERKGGGLEFGTHYSNLEQENRDTTWDKFSTKSLRMSEDDDEEEEEGDEEEEEED